MSQSIQQVKNNLIGMSHTGTLNKVRNINNLFERAANNILARIDPIETMRTLPVPTAVHDEVDNYTLASDFKKMIDLIPQSNRNKSDSAVRKGAENYELRRIVRNKEFSIESSEGTKFIRINWKSRTSQTLHKMDNITGNGTWSTVTGASNLKQDQLFKKSGSASLSFDLDTSGGGLKNSTFDSLNLTNDDELSEFFLWLYLPSPDNLTSVTGIWGNDLSTKFWTSTAQTTQQDGTAFKIGWNLIKFPWSTATETGIAVDPSDIDSFKFTLATTGAIANVRADNIIVSLGRNFDNKYYSQFAFQNSSGTWIQRPTATDDSDVVVLDGTGYNIFLYECAQEIAYQLAGEDSGFDINLTSKKLNGDPGSPDPIERRGLYSHYRREFPSQAKKETSQWFGQPRFRDKRTNRGRI